MSNYFICSYFNDFIIAPFLAWIQLNKVINDKGEATSWAVCLNFLSATWENPIALKKSINSQELRNLFLPTPRAAGPEARTLPSPPYYWGWIKAPEPACFFSCLRWSWWGREVKFVQAWCVQRGGLSHTRWRMKGQRWHSLAQEWKTFSAENREATSGRGSSGRPWFSMHHFGEFVWTTRTKITPCWLNTDHLLYASLGLILYIMYYCTCLACMPPT